MDPDDMMQYYIEIGAVEVAGIDDHGDFIFKITPLAKEIAPELWQAHSEHIDEVLLYLFEKELVKVEYDENLNATFEITKEGRQIALKNGLVEFDE
jgi:hypothetical protein